MFTFSPRDVVDKQVTNCFNVDMMAEKISDLIENPKLRQEMSDNTLLDKEKLKMKNVIKKWEELL